MGHTVVADSLKSSNAEPIISESVQRYGGDYTLEDPRDLLDLQTAQALLAAYLGSTAFLFRDGLNTPINDMNWGGYGIWNLGILKDTTGVSGAASLDISGRSFFDLNELSIADYSDRTNGFKVTSNGYFAAFKTDNLTAGKTVQFQNINYTGVADLTDIPTVAGVYAPIAGGFSFTGNVNGVTPSELAHLSGATSNIQNQINNINSGLFAKQSARVLSISNINLSSLPATIDGITMSIGESFVCNGQTLGSENGVYLFNGVGVAASRRPDCSTGGSGGTGIRGMTITIEEGAAADQIWILTTDSPIVVGTTSLSFSKSSNTTYTGSNGITLTANNFTLDNSYFSGDISLSGGAATVGAIQNKAITLATGFLKYNGSAFVFDNSTYATLAGADTQIQYNNSGAMGANANFTYSSALSKLTVNAKIEQNFSESGAAAFTLTNGTTAINAGVITYDANTVIKVGDVVTGTGIASYSIVYEIIDATSARLSNHCTSAQTGVTFTVYPLMVANHFNYTATSINNQLGAGTVLESTNTNGNGLSRTLLVINRDTANASTSAVEIMAKGNHLTLTSPTNAGNLGTTWFMESGTGVLTSNGNFGFGKTNGGARSLIYQITQGGQMQWNGTSSITSSGSLGLQATTQIVVGKSNATVTPTSGNINFLLVGFENTTSANYYWNPASGTATLNVITANPNITQSGSATGGVNLFNATPTSASIATGGYLRGYYSNINDGTGTIHQLYLQGTANSYINSNQTGFGTASPDAACLVDFVSSTKGIGLTSLTTSTIASLSAAKNGTIAYQNDGVEGLYLKKSSGWSIVGGTTDYIFSFQKAGSLTYSMLNADSGATAFTNSMAFVVPKAMSLQDISIIFGTSSASGAGSLIFTVKKISVGIGNTGNGTAISLGSGTAVGSVTLNSGGALGVAYYRNNVSLNINGSLDAGDIIWVETNNFTGWSVTDVKCEIRCN